MKADYHMHTSFSDDSIYPMEDVVKKSISLGYDEICFCEHVDHGVRTDLNCNYELYYKELERCRKKYVKQIIIRCGMEFGMQRHTIKQFETDFKKLPFDFILLSCHQIDNKEFWNQEYQKGKTQDEINQKYYEEILYVMKHYNHYSVLAHLDAIRRDDPFGDYPFEKVKPLVTEILLWAIEHGKGIEINTSNVRYGLLDYTPCRAILELYYELGGTILTFGSDSHKEEHVGAYIDNMRQVAKEIGFKQFCTFDKMVPIYHNL